MNCEELILNNCDLGIAYECMLACRMCFFWKDSPLDKSNTLSIEEWKQVLEQISEFKMTPDCRVNFSGPGEPFLRKNIIDLISYGRTLKLPIHVISNGYLVDENLSKQINNCGLEFLSFSLDSLNSEEHDFLRGRKTSLDKVINAIQVIQSNAKNVEIGINTVISKANMESIPALVDWVESDDAIKYINFPALFPK